MIDAVERDAPVRNDVEKRPDGGTPTERSVEVKGKK
jgi:hypothetical protein